MDLEGFLETDIVGDSEETIDDIVEDSIEAIDDIAEDPVEITEDILDSGVEDLAAENDSNDDEISLTNEEIVAAKEELSDDVFSDYFEDPELFSKYSEYEYQEGEYGKNARGTLELTSDVERNSYNQRIAGGEERRIDDDGGHLIGNRFGGSSELDNIVPQNRNLNRGAYKQLENEWDSLLKDDEKVFVDINTYEREGGERPTAFMGTAIIEDTEGKRHWDAFSFTNESNSEIEKWQKEVDELYEET